MIPSKDCSSNWILPNKPICLSYPFLTIRSTATDNSLDVDFKVEFYGNITRLCSKLVLIFILEHMHTNTTESIPTSKPRNTKPSSRLTMMTKNISFPLSKEWPEATQIWSSKCPMSMILQQATPSTRQVLEFLQSMPIQNSNLSIIQLLQVKSMKWLSRKYETKSKENDLI